MPTKKNLQSNNNALYVYSAYDEDMNLGHYVIFSPKDKMYKRIIKNIEYGDIIIYYLEAGDRPYDIYYKVYMYISEEPISLYKFTDSDRNKKTLVLIDHNFEEYSECKHILSDDLNNIIYLSSLYMIKFIDLRGTLSANGVIEW
jgi:hypothetical protein